MASGTGNNYNWIDELLQVNSNTSMSYTEALCTNADLETYCNVSKEELNRFKNEIEKGEEKYKNILELRDTLRTLYDELKISDKRADKVIKVKICNVELAQEIHDLKKQKALEKEKQDKIIKTQLNDVYKESMKIFESNPLVIKRKQIRNQVSKRKFEISFLKQKMSDSKKIYANLQNVEKQIEQKKIIKFAEAMVKYYQDQKKKNEIRINKQNLKNIDMMQEQTNNSNIINEKPQENVMPEPPKKLEFNSFLSSTNFDFLYKKTLSRYQTSVRNIETPILNLKQIQIPTLNMSNYQFNPKNYFNRVISKSTDLQKPKQPMSNIFNTSKPNLVSSTFSKLENSFKKSTPSKPKQDKISTNQTKQKTDLKRPADTQESIIKPKVPAMMKNNQDIKLALNTSTEKEERIFLSQPGSKNSSQFEDTFITLSQDSKKSVSSNSSQLNVQGKIPKNKKTSKMDNISINQSSQSNRQPIKPNQMFNLNAENSSLSQSQNKRQSSNQMFNLQSTVPPFIETKELPKQIQTTCSRQTMGPVFNLQATAPKRTEINEPQQQNPTESYRKASSINQMFNLQPTAPKKTETNEPQLQNTTESYRQMFNLQATVPKRTETNEPQQQNPTETYRQMFNLQATVPKRTEANEQQQQNLIESYRQTPSMNKMFNLQATVPKNIVTNEAQKQNIIEQTKRTPILNQMFNLQTMTPKKTGTSDMQKTPMENISKTVNLLNPASQHLETKSPYFANQTITSQEESASINTSAEQSDKVVNISSDQPNSELSAANTSGEFFDANMHQPLDIEQMMSGEGAPAMDYADAGYMMQYFAENQDDVMSNLGETQYISPPFPSSPVPNELISRENQQNNIPVSAANNMFSAAQSTGNSFFNFGKSEPKSGSIYNLF